ncbi:DUF6049 family protein [Cellulomonas sp. PhB150]|uniref:DUF6049 family protein n=1 Tax=Cellulomonas sp. PhB150 TaxID=2485188 RepID=UPI000F988B30|nr:DUF6049 family protein [Cellulomonas sp. PhB150]ROS26244.1 hypothetical protein EDF34_2577 [Cellulomonas sp. PhB150]
MSGRLARRVLSATLALVAGLILVPALPASAADEPLPVRVEITSISPVVLRPGDDLTVRATLHNDGATELKNVAADLRINYFRMGSRDEVAAWTDRADSDLAGQIAVAQALGDPLAPGASADVTLTVPAARMYFTNLPGVWGPRGLAVEATDGGTRAGLARSYALWYPEQSVTPVPVSVLLPVAGPATNPLATTPVTGLDQLTAPTGRLGRTLAAVQVDDAIGIAADPALVEQALSGGTGSKAWAQAMTAASTRHATFTLPWSDPDAAAVAHADAGSLFQVAADHARRSDVLGAGRRTVVWAAPGQNLDEETATMAAGADVVAAVTRTPAVGASSAVTHARMSTDEGSLDRLAPDGTLSALLSDPKAVDPDATDATTAQRTLAELALVARENESSPGPVLLAPARDQVPDPAAVRVVMTALRSAPWVQVDPVSTLLVGTASQVDVPANGKAADDEIPPAEVETLAAARDHAVGFSAVTADPATLLSGVDAETLAPLALAWRADLAGRTDLAGNVVKEVAARTVGLSIAPLSDINVISAEAPIRPVVRNDLAVPATVQLVMTPRKACLQVDPIDPVTIDAGSSATVVVHLEATANCDVTVTATLESPAGDVVAAPREFTARVSPTIESVGTYVVGALLVVGLILGIVRTVRRGQSARRGARSASGPVPPLPVLGGVPDEDQGT